MELQVNYYKMPMPSSAPRIESPATLGRKCWAFAYLAHVWTSLKPALERALARAPGLSLSKLFAAYDAAVSLTMGLCDQVMANCFVNATYNPARNGTCPEEEGQFYVGYQWYVLCQVAQPRVHVFQEPSLGLSCTFHHAQSWTNSC